MRELLTGLAIVLIVVLTTILVAPYFVDWNGQRGFLEARLSHALGQPVTIGGHIDLKLLPTPFLVLDQVVVGDDDAPVRIGIHHLDLELSAAPLLHGEFDITEARLNEPRVRVTLQPDHALPALPKAPAFTADVRFDRIHISDGTLSVADPTSGRTFVFDHLDLDADAGSFSGPFKVNGRQGSANARTSFRLSSATPQAGRSHVHFMIDETPVHAAYDFDGNVGLEKSGGDSLRQRFEGNVAVTGHLREANAVSIPWKLSGPFKADPMQAELSGGELRLGEENTVTLTADAKGDFRAPHMSLDLSAKQLDIDRLSGPPAEPTKPPPPPKLPDLTALRHLLRALVPPVRTALDLSIENALYGGETLTDLQAHLGLGEATQPLRVSAAGPGGAHIALDGNLTTAEAPSFDGRVEFAADNLPRLADWLASVAPSFPWTAADLRFKTAKIDGPLKIADDKVDSAGIALALDRSVLKGKAHVAFGNETRATRIAADLAADPLDLDSLPSLASLSGPAGPFDLDLKLDAKAMKVARVGTSPLQTGPIKLAFTKAGRRIELRRFQADDLGGAKIDANGSLDAEHGALALSLDAARLDRFAALVQQVVPGDLADRLAARASALSPAKLKIDADVSGPPDRTSAPPRITIAGTLGGTKIDASAKPNPAHATSVSATADAPEGSALLAQLGFKTLPGVKVGRSHLALSARGRRGDRVEATLDAAFGETKLDMTGGFDLRSGGSAGAGTVHLESPDVAPLLQSLAIAFPDMAERVPAELSGSASLARDGPSIRDMTGRIADTGVTGTLAWHRDAREKPALTGKLELDKASLAALTDLALGSNRALDADAAWSTQQFAEALIDPPRSEIALGAKVFEIRPGVAATNANLTLGAEPNLLRLDKVEADLGGGKASGNAKIRRDGHQATLEGKLALDGVAIDLSPLGAKLKGQMDFAGNGSAAKGLVASLAGSGEVTAADLSIKSSDPAALPKIFDDVENDVLAVDEETVVRAFGDAAKAPLPAGTRHFGLSLVAGALHFNPKDPALPERGPVASTVEGVVDLTRWALEANVGETLLKLPKNWSGPPPTVVVKFSGPIGKPARSYDVSAFLNALAARALAREAARVEAYEFDLRERAFFNARLQTERRREQERRLAQEQAEEERKSRDEAARKERLRKQQEEREKASKDNNDKAVQDKKQDDQSKAGAGEPPSPPHRPRPSISDPSTFGRY